MNKIINTAEENKEAKRELMNSTSCAASHLTGGTKMNTRQLRQGRGRIGVRLKLNLGRGKESCLLKWLVDCFCILFVLNS